MDARILKILEFDKVKQQIQSCAVCSLGRNRLADLAPYAKPAEAEAELQTVDEALQFLLRLGPLPYGGITDIEGQLQKAAIGGVLSTVELNAVIHFIYGSRHVRHAVESALDAVEIPHLRELATELFDARQTEVEIREAVAEDGTVFDSASPELRRLRQARKQLESGIRNQLDNMLRSQQKILQDPIIAMRGNSFCLPVRVEFKNQVPGIVHDYSASGATVFVEPQAVVEASAKVRMIAAEEEREVERILQQLSALVAGVSQELLRNVEVLGQFDAWFAKADYARREYCERPTIREDGVWTLRKARHPLIARGVSVPVDLTLGGAFQMLIITGPNTGGKTVTLKTVGLLTLLAMSGCFIPTGQPSEIGWCDNIYADIGDEQSIEQSLSTFSAHMKSIVGMMESVSRESLVLLDELGAGTDPAEGSALSIAILDHLKGWGARVVATTHYAELKGYAFREPQAMNASMEFDVQTLRPTYRLMVGVPGRSNALAIARRLGLSEHIVENAKKFIHSDDIRIEDLIGKMETARREAEEMRAQVQVDRDIAQAHRRSLEDRVNALDAETDKIRERARLEAQEVVGKASAEANRIIQELRGRQSSGLSKDHELVALRKQLEEAGPGQANPLTRRRKASETIHVGSTVQVLSLGLQGEVLEQSDGGKELTVQLGLLRTKVKASDVEWVKGVVEAQGVKTVRRGMPKSMPLQLDIRGETVDEALPRVDKYLDDAVMNGLARVTIIHGKGTGALRDGVRRYLGRHTHVKTWAPGGPGEGGDGASIVEVH